MHFIMAIENDVAASTMLEGFFMGLRQRVIITKFSLTVKEYVKSSNPDIILMGLTFKDKRELEFVLELRRDVITQGIPILALIPKEDPNFISNHKALGFTDFMIKPFEKSSLLDKINSLVDDHKFNEGSKVRDSMSFVVIERNASRVIFQCRANLKKYVFPEFRKIFTPNFLKSITKEYVCFDLRGVPEINQEDVQIFERILKIFSNKEKMYFIAGRHMGVFVEFSENEDLYQVFMAPNEFEDFLKVEEQGKKEKDKDKKEKAPAPGQAASPQTPTPESNAKSPEAPIANPVIVEEAAPKKESPSEEGKA